jgi:hypothetical protein
MCETAVERLGELADKPVVIHSTPKTFLLNEGHTTHVSKSQVRREREQRRPSRDAGTGPGTEMPSGERKILTALAQHGRMDKARLARITGFASNGGGFNNYLSSLRTKGWIDGRGDMGITTDGKKALGKYEPLPEGDQLYLYWLNHPRLGKAERTSMEVLRKYYPKSITKEVIAKGAGYESNGGGFNNALSMLRTLGIMEGRGEFLLSADLVG